MHVQLDPVFTGGDFGAGFLEFLKDGFKDGRIGVLDLDAAASNGSGDQVGTGFDAVRHDAVGRRTQALDAIDGDGVGTGALDFRTHGVEEVGKVDHFRLARGVLQHAAAFGQGCGHHDVLGTGHTDGIEEEVCATQAAFRGLGLDVAAFDLDLRAHGFKAADVQVDRTRTNGATAGQGHFGFAKAGNHRAQYQDRGAHGFHQLVRRDQGLDGARIDLYRELLVDHRLNAHAAEQLDHGGDVVQVRQVADRNRTIAKQSTGQNRQSRVLGTGNADFAIKTNAASNNQFVHFCLAANLGSVALSPGCAAEKFHGYRMDAAIGDPRIKMSIDLLLTLDRAQGRQFVADHVQLEVAAFAFNFDPGSRQLFFKEVLNFYGLHAQPQSAPCARGSAIIQKSPSPANPVIGDSDRGASRWLAVIDRPAPRRGHKPRRFHAYPEALREPRQPCRPPCHRA
ncbi:hypothetical protein D3C77_152930 [compost metagenome]